MKSTNSRALLLSLVLLTACSSLQPVDLPAEYSAPADDAGLWHAAAAGAAGDWQSLLNEGPSALDWRLRAIDGASTSIELQTFLWSFDQTGSMMLDHLLTAADRGVRIRVLIDDSFLISEDPLLMAFARHPNISYRVFNPYQRRAGSVVTRQLLNLAEFWRLDHRMHNKVMIVDSQIALVGGRNLADEYFGLHGQANFRDLELLLGGSVVGALGAAFDDYWNNRWTIPIESVGHATASAAQLADIRKLASQTTDIHLELSAQEQLRQWRQLIAQAHAGTTTLYVDKPPVARPGRGDDAPVQVADELVRLFDSARKEIVVVSAYLIPTPALQGAVARAVGRGVRVRILTNSIGSNNHLTAHSAYRKHIGSLLDEGAELYEVQVHAQDRARYMVSPVGRKILSLHAKALIIDDDKVFIGSANLDPRSLRINTEVGVLVHSKALNQHARAALDPDFSGSNAWRLELQEDGRVHWVSSDRRLTSQPAISETQRLEDWMFSLIPMDSEL